MTAADALPVVRPQCSRHGSMELRVGGTAQQRWCGTWYDCPGYDGPRRCLASALLASSALLA